MKIALVHDQLHEFGGAELNDVLVLYDILQKYKRADVSRVGMYGASRGGMMTYLALARVSWIKGAVILAGTSNLMGNKEFRPQNEGRYIRTFGGSEEEKIKRSAIYFVDRLPKNVPILLMHGTADWRVNPLDSIKMAEELYKNKVPFRLVMFEGGDHFFSEFGVEKSKFMLDWFDRYVKNNGPLPDLEPHGK